MLFLPDGGWSIWSFLCCINAFLKCWFFRTALYFILALALLLSPAWCFRLPRGSAELVLGQLRCRPRRVQLEVQRNPSCSVCRIQHVFKTQCEMIDSVSVLATSLIRTSSDLVLWSAPHSTCTSQCSMPRLLPVRKALATSRNKKVYQLISWHARLCCSSVRIVRHNPSHTALSVFQVRRQQCN